MFIVKIKVVKKSRTLPDTEKLSILIAAILLAYSMTQFITIPERLFAFEFTGFYLAITLNARNLIGILVIGLTAMGSEWIFREHPEATNHGVYQHWLLPSLTSWAIGYPITQLSFSPIWLASFIFGGVLLVLVLLAEYITIDPSDVRQPIATIVLTAVSYSIYLTLAIVLQNLETRLIIMLPTIFIISFLVSLRTFQLHIPTKKLILEALALALMCCQIAAALHYWPLSPIAYGLALLAPAYTIAHILINIYEGVRLPNALIEPLIAFTFLWGLAYWLK